MKKRDEDQVEKWYGSADMIGPKELEKVCRGGPEVLFVGSGKSDKLRLTDEAHRYLVQRSIQCEVLPTAKVASTSNYNRASES